MQESLKKKTPGSFGIQKESQNFQVESMFIFFRIKKMSEKWKVFNHRLYYALSYNSNWKLLNYLLYLNLRTLDE